jgi:hypothetical protein
MSAEALTSTSSVDDKVDIIFRNATVGSVPRTALLTFCYWRAVETSAADAIDELDMTPCIEATCGHFGAGLTDDVHLWIRHLQQQQQQQQQQQPSTAEMSDA